MGPVIGPLKGTRFWMFCEHFIRRAAGLGRAGYARDTARYERMNAFCDVLVVGSGPAGLMAAKAAAERGQRVILAELDPRFGGAANWSDETIDGMPAADWAAPRRRGNCPSAAMSACSTARRCGAITTAICLRALERVTDHRASPARASRAIATGRSAPAPSCWRPARSSGRWCFPAMTGQASCWPVRPNATPTSSA